MQVSAPLDGVPLTGLSRYLSDSFYPHSQTVDRGLCRDKECMPVGAAEGDVGRPAGIDGDVLDLLAGGIEDRNPPASQVNVALVVDSHAVRAHRAEKLFA